MKKIAFLFTHSPHGSSAGREGLDMVLATSAYSDNISVFFIGDGVFQLLPDQQPECILSRNYIATFGVFPLYDITQCYLCAESLAERGLSEYTAWVIDANVMAMTEVRQRLAEHDIILTF